MHWLDWALLAPVCGSGIYYILTCYFIRNWFALPARLSEDLTPLPPVTFFRPIKSGVPCLAEKIRMLAQAARPGDQIILGVDSEEDRMVCEAVRKEAADGVDIVVVTGQAAATANPKITRLVAMVPAARHDLWIVSDCEAMPDPGFMTRFRRDWLGQGVDALTCGYRFVRMENWAGALDATAALLALWPGIAIVRSTGRVRLTLGACTGFHRTDLEEIGGWKRFESYLAEDNRIGAALAEKGCTIGLSREVLSLEMDPLNWKEYFFHQHRVAVTYRVCAPAGYFGMVFTQGISWALLLVCAGPFQPWRWLVLAAIYGMRLITTADNARVIGFAIPRLPAAVLIGSLAESILWLLSWLNIPVRWGSRRFFVQNGGTFRRG